MIEPSLQHSRFSQTDTIRALLLMTLSLAAFSPVIFGGGFFWDDHTLLLDSYIVHSSLYDIWFSTKNVDYIPMVSSTFWLEWKLWGASAPPYHLVNALLHGGSGILFWQILRTLRIPGALLAAILFVIHPVNAESVAWIAERKNTLSMLFMMASLLAYLHARRSKAIPLTVAAIGLFLLALLSKGAVVMLPFVLLMLAWWQNRRITLADIAHSMPYFALSLFFGLVTIYFQAHNSIGSEVVRDDGFLSRLAIAGCAVWFYLFKLFLPVNIIFNYPRWDIATYGIWAFVPLAVLVIVFIALFQLRHTRARHLLAALSIYVLMLFPILGFVNIFYMRYSLVSDHWQYHATPAMFAWIAASAVWLYYRMAKARKIFAMAMAWAGGVVLFTYTFYIAMIYRTPESIWENTLTHNPSSWLAHAQLGDIRVSQGRLPEAINHLSRVVELDPKQAMGYVNLGKAFTAIGNNSEAIDILNHALQMPDATPEEKARAYESLGTLYGRQGQLDKAESYFARAHDLNPQSFTINFYLGMTYFSENKLELARVPLENAAAIMPEDIRSRVYLARIAIQEGSPEKAAAIAREILTLDPQNADALAILYPPAPPRPVPAAPATAGAATQR